MNLPMIPNRKVKALTLRVGDVIKDPKGNEITIRHKVRSTQVVPARRVKMVFISADGHGFGGGVVNASMTANTEVELVSRNTWYSQLWLSFLAWRNRNDVVKG